MKHDPETPELAREASEFEAEAVEAIMEVEQGLDAAAPESWVARAIRRGV